MTIRTYTEISRKPFKAGISETVMFLEAETGIEFGLCPNGAIEVNGIEIDDTHRLDRDWETSV